MKIEKIKAVKNDFHESCGPSETISLGIKVNDDTYMLGTFYFGPGMGENQVGPHNRLERFIDHVVKLVKDHEPKCRKG